MTNHSDNKNKPFVWEMIRDAMEDLGGKSSNVEVRDWIVDHHPGVSPNTIQATIVICTVNHESRIHYTENQRPRRSDGQFDLLFRPAPGQLVLYDPRLHGIWEIAEGNHGFLFVRKVDMTRRGKSDEIALGAEFIEETHLRMYLANNLAAIEEGLELYVDDYGNDGVEFKTDIGNIDILAINKAGNFAVVELKIDRSSETASGQILGYINWVRRHLAKNNPVRGYIIAPHIPDTIRYATAGAEDIFLKEYTLSISLKDVAKI